MAVETKGAYGLYQAKKEQTSPEAQKKKADELAKERQFIDQATQAGFDMASLYGDAAKQYEKFMRQGMQAQGQLTPRLLQGASAFGSPGGAALVAAEGLAPSITAAQSQLGMSGTDKILGAGVGGQEAERGAAEYAMSSLPSVIKQNKVLGYLDTYGSLRKTMGDQEAQDALFQLLLDEIDPDVVTQVQNTILAMR